MTEKQWNACTEPDKMLEVLRDSGRASDRKLRLFAAACVRRVWHLLTEESSRYAIELSERSADEPISYLELDLVSGGAEAAYMYVMTDDEGVFVDDDHPRLLAAHAASYASCPGPLEVERHLNVAVRASAGASSLGAQGESAIQATLLRDIFGPLPSRPFPPDESAWLAWDGSTIKQLAEAAYQERTLPSGHLVPDRLAVLADALKEVGADASLLAHLRSPGAHVRGCWAIDMLTGREASP